MIERPLARGFAAWLGATLLAAFRWKVVLAQPVPDRCVIIFYPHTSNWDTPIGLCLKFMTGLEVHYAGKDSLFRVPVYQADLKFDADFDFSDVPGSVPEVLSGRWLTMDIDDLDGDGYPDIVLGSFIRGPTKVPPTFERRWEAEGPSFLILKNISRKNSDARGVRADERSNTAD